MADGAGCNARQEGRIESFFQRVPKGTPSNTALAGPPRLEQPAAQQVQAAMRPATEEERHLDMLDYANRMVGGGRVVKLSQQVLAPPFCQKVVARGFGADACVTGLVCFLLL